MPKGGCCISRSIRALSGIFTMVFSNGNGASAVATGGLPNLKYTNAPANKTTKAKTKPSKNFSTPLDPPALDLDLPLAILLAPLVLHLGSVLRESSGIYDAATKGDDKSAIQDANRGVAQGWLPHTLPDGLNFSSEHSLAGNFSPSSSVGYFAKLRDRQSTPNSQRSERIHEPCRAELLEPPCRYWKPCCNPAKA